MYTNIIEGIYAEDFPHDALSIAEVHRILLQFAPGRVITASSSGGIVKSSIYHASDTQIEGFVPCCRLESMDLKLLLLERFISCRRKQYSQRRAQYLYLL